ncbi:MAG: LolA family protein [Bacteriovoracaceae bacterium]
MNKLFFLLVFFFSSSWAAFLPSSFRANFEQSFKSTITGKEKKSSGSIDYLFPGKIRFEITNPDNTIFVSNGSKAWYYTAPFDPKEKGEVIVQPANKLLITKFFDYLKKGLESNEAYSVKKEKDFFVLTFSEKAQKELSIMKAHLDHQNKDLTKISELKSLVIFYKDGKEVKLSLNGLIENVKFEKSYFEFKVPENTKVVNQN